MNCLNRAIVGTATLAIGFCALTFVVNAADPLSTMLLAEDDYAKLIAKDAKVILDIANGKTDLKPKAAANKAKSAAMMIALYAQSQLGGKNAAAMATLRDKALQTYEKIAAGKPADAKELAAQLTVTIKADSNANTKPINLLDRKAAPYEISDLMHAFGSEKGGGDGLEKKIQTAQKLTKAPTPAEIAELIEVLNKTAALGQYTEAMPPAQEMGKKTKKEWIKLSVEMQKSSAAAAKEIKGLAKPDPKSIKAIVSKVEVSCNDCHTIFRE